MTADSPVVVPLSACSANDLNDHGGKGANLGELVRAGFPVPDGFVVTTAAYDAAIAGTDLDERIARGDHEAVRALFDELPLPDGLDAAILAGYLELGEPAVAVRSSATAEDLPEASFAGQQDTFLNVTGADALLRAVRHCWASLWGERAVAYRAQHHTGGAPRIAVVVQRLILAEVAGVMFTANPASGRREQTVITAAWGLGEAVVGGLVEPDEFVVGDDAGTPVQRRIAAKRVRTVPNGGDATQGTSEEPTPSELVDQPTLDDAQVRELAALGRRVQQHFGAPQDIEWALAEGSFVLLQARPITALPEPTGEVPVDWPLPRDECLYFRASIVEQLPDPLTPLFADLARVAVPAGLSALMGELSPRTIDLDIDFPTINGYAYYAYSKKSMNKMWSITPYAIKMLTHRDFVLSRWRDRALPAYRASVAVWSGQDPALLSAATLLSATRELLEAGCRYYTNVQMVIPMAATTELSWTALYDTVLRGSDEAQASDFLLGFDSAPIVAEKDLHQLADWCRGVPGLAEALAAVSGGLPELPPDGVDATAWAELHRRIDAHLADYGHTLYNLDFANPVPADDPAPVLESLRHAVAGRGVDPRERQQRMAERRARLTRELVDRLDPVRRKLARGSLKGAQRWAPIREDALAAMGLAWPTMRRLLRNLGDRLVDAGAIEEADHVYWLTAAEADAAAVALDAGTAVDNRSAQVAQRRMIWRGQSLATPPQYLPVSGWVTLMDGMMPAHSGDQNGPVLKGTGGSGGRVTASARVLAGPADFAAFQPGEILVASITTPAYTPLFALAAGVVTDIGGVLSHGSIVAREYGIPAVLGTGVATKRITTGDVISLDGSAGTVHLDGAPEAAAPTGRAVPTWAWVTGAAAATAGVVALVARSRR